MKLVAMAIPVFLLLIGIELAVARVRKRQVYRFSDAVTDLACGISSQVLWILLSFGVYAWLFTHFRLVTWAESSVWPWVIGFVGFDFFYYWFHRASHRVNVIWSAHIVHHQSEDYNLAVALRQAWFQPQFSRWFYLPLALAGVEPSILVLSGGVSLLYQFWIHTELIGRLGPLEWVLNTPSHHRVHHGTNPQYLDKNYGAILIVWDRIFGSFEPEVEPVRYGITNPLRSYNPWWANFHYWVELAGMARRADRLTDKLRVWFMPPEWKPAGVEAPPVWDGRHKYDPPTPRESGAYVMVQFLLLTPALAVIMFFGEELPQSVFLGAGGLLIVATLVWGGLLERKAWARTLELVRLVAAGGYAYWIVGDYAGPSLGIAAALFASLPFAAWLVARGRRMDGVESGPLATAA